MGFVKLIFLETHSQLMFSDSTKFFLSGQKVTVWHWVVKGPPHFVMSTGGEHWNQRCIFIDETVQGVLQAYVFSD
jgi:hypothetical protein